MSEIVSGQLNELEPPPAFTHLSLRPRAVLGPVEVKALQL